MSRFASHLAIFYLFQTEDKCVTLIDAPTYLM